MTKLIVGNWKMNGISASLAEAKAIADGVAAMDQGRVRVVICPPATLLVQMRALLGNGPVSLGGQDCDPRDFGSHTGDISAHMLADAGARFVIVGHSERRDHHRESNMLVQAKARAAIDAGLMPIICVGETQAERDADQAEACVLEQVEGSIPNDAKAYQFCLAYEPIWAIGSGRTPNATEIGSIHSAIATALYMRFGPREGQVIGLLYGGSVTAKNAADLMSIPYVDGVLVGGASLRAAEFLDIIHSQA
jgi:triosephosphate isomerase (TIM)